MGPKDNHRRPLLSQTAAGGGGGKCGTWGGFQTGAMDYPEQARDGTWAPMGPPGDPMRPQGGPVGASYGPMGAPWGYGTDDDGDDDFFHFGHSFVCECASTLVLPVLAQLDSCAARDSEYARAGAAGLLRRTGFLRRPLWALTRRYGALDTAARSKA